MQWSRVSELVKPWTTHLASPLMPTRTVAVRAVGGCSEHRAYFISGYSVAIRTRVEGRAEPRAGEVDADATPSARVRDLRLIGACNTLNNGAGGVGGDLQDNPNAEQHDGAG